MTSVKTDAETILHVMKNSPFNCIEEILFHHIFTSNTILRIKRVMGLIPMANASSKLVDIGCYGPMISLYKDILGYNDIYAISKYDWDILSKKHEALSENGFTLHVIIEDVERSMIPISDQSIDIVLLLEILEHFSIDPMHVLSEINRILKLGGHLILSTPNAISASLLYKYLSGENPCGEPYNGIDANRHNRLYTPYEVRALGEASGFETNHLTTIDLQGDIYRHLIKIMTKGIDLFQWWRKNNNKYQRGQIILTQMTKKTEVSDRHPSWLYLQRKEWDSWYQLKRVDNS